MPRQLADWERTMGMQMGALPGMHVICEGRDDPGDYRAALVDELTDWDGYRLPWAFVIDAETRDTVEPDDVYAVVLPGADPDAALEQFRESATRIDGRTEWVVTTAQTVYEDYRVLAESEEDAIRKVARSPVRAVTESEPGGDAGDESPIAAKPA